MNVENLNKLADVLMKMELHAFALLACGIALVLTGHKDEGTLVLGGALGIFRGSK
jgi:hypothetical protein